MTIANSYLHSRIFANAAIYIFACLHILKVQLKERLVDDEVEVICHPFSRQHFLAFQRFEQLVLFYGVHHQLNLELRFLDRRKSQLFNILATDRENVDFCAVCEHVVVSYCLLVMSIHLDHVQISCRFLPFLSLSLFDLI